MLKSKDFESDVDFGEIENLDEVFKDIEGSSDFREKFFKDGKFDIKKLDEYIKYMRNLNLLK